MFNIYVSECNVEIAQGPGRPRIIMAKGVRFSGTDKAVQRVLKTYPRVALVSSEPEPAPAKLDTASAVALHDPAPEPVRVTAGGVQMKERRPQGGRGIEG
jgi:hypothetical protein